MTPQYKELEGKKKENYPGQRGFNVQALGQSAKLLLSV